MGPRALGAEAAAQVSAGRVRPGVISEQERAQGYEQSRIVYAAAPEHLPRQHHDHNEHSYRIRKVLSYLLSNRGDGSNRL